MRTPGAILSAATADADGGGDHDDFDPSPEPRPVAPWHDFWRRPRQPLAGVALAASVGILLADRFDGDPWAATGGFLALALWFALRPRLWLCWLVIAAGFAALHLFQLHAVPAETLARQLADGQPHTVRATGRIIDEPRLAASGKTWRFTLELERIEVNGLAWDCRARVAAYWRDGAPACGDRLELVGQARNVPPTRNPAEFDFAAFLRRDGIRSELRFNGLTDVRAEHRRPGLLHRAAVRFHDWMRATLGIGLEHDPAAGAIISTMLLGLKDAPGLGDSEEMFQRTGTLHYFAIDGLKLALLSWLALWTLTRCGMPRAWAGTIILPSLAFYSLATGLGPASLRATLMAAALLGAYWLERPLRALNSLGAAATLLLACDTHQLFDLGFQLSFVVVVAIIVLCAALHHRLMDFGAPDPFLPRKLFSTARRRWETFRRWGWGLVSVSLAAWIGSLPLMIVYFYVVSPISPLANIVTFPLAWLTLALGVVALTGAGLLTLIPGASAAASGWALAVNKVNLLVAKAFLLTVQTFDAAPAGSYYIPAAPEWPFNRPAVEITALDLGNARAIHLRAGRADWLVDAGSVSKYGASVRPYLRSRGINRLDGLILSQGDSNHLAAAPLALAEFAPSRILTVPTIGNRSVYGRDFLRLLQTQRRSVTVSRAGHILPLGRDAELRALWPPPDLKSGPASNRALAWQLRAADWRVLFMANAGTAVQRALLQNASPDALLSDVLITGAPGESLLEELNFLRLVNPRLVILQPPAEYDAPSTLAPSMPSGIKLIRLEDSGAVHLRFYADRIEASGFVDKRRAVIRH
jgi:competence protein ComEC